MVWPIKPILTDCRSLGYKQRRVPLWSLHLRPAVNSKAMFKTVQHIHINQQLLDIETLVIRGSGNRVIR